MRIMRIAALIALHFMRSETHKCLELILLLLHVKERHTMTMAVNFIPDTVYEMLEAWELSQQQYEVEMSESKRPTATNLSTYGAGQQVHGTTTRSTMSADSPPPKLFYRTFWRSIARRLMENSQ